MELGRVEGTVVSTAKVERLKGYKLLLVNLIGPDTKPTSNYLVAVDGVGAGKDEVVIVVRGSSARASRSIGSRSGPFASTSNSMASSIVVRASAEM